MSRGSSPRAAPAQEPAQEPTPEPAEVAGTGSPRAPARALLRLALALAAATVLAEVAYPLLSGGALRAATVLSVLLFAGASLAGAGATHGRRAVLALLLGAGGTGLVAEATGVATGVPFGAYAYAGTLGPQLLGVPLVVPVAWLMMAWPALLAGRAAAGGLRLRGAAAACAPAVLAAWLLAAWDLYLDPQMVAAGHWRWAAPAPSLPGVPGVPLTNDAGWLLVALVIQGVLHRAVPRRALPGAPRGAALGAGAPALLLAWTWLGSGVANLAFFGRPAVGAWGLLAMGAVAGPALWRLRRTTRADQADRADRGDRTGPGAAPGPARVPAP